MNELTGKYDIITADPPWRFMGWSKKGDIAGRGYTRHYDIMETSEICKLPVGDISNDNSVLFLWVTTNRIPDALKVMDAWGFSYKSVAFTWAKTNKSGGLWMGTGYWTRGNAEFCLLGVRGKGLVPQCKNVQSTVMAGRREHSRKPDEVYNNIDRMFPEGKRIELFARHPRENWDTWGDELNE